MKVPLLILFQFGQISFYFKVLLFLSSSLFPFSIFYNLPFYDLLHYISFEEKSLSFRKLFKTVKSAKS